jgi:hypothetical protein
MPRKRKAHGQGNLRYVKKLRSQKRSCETELWNQKQDRIAKLKTALPRGIPIQVRLVKTDMMRCNLRKGVVFGYDVEVLHVYVRFERFLKTSLVATGNHKISDLWECSKSWLESYMDAHKMHNEDWLFEGRSDILDPLWYGMTMDTQHGVYMWLDEMEKSDQIHQLLLRYIPIVLVNIVYTYF